MQAFLSYSIHDNDEFVIPILAGKLRGEGFYPINGPFYENENYFSRVCHMIQSSNLFIGLITNSGFTNERVHREWRLSSDNDVPSVLLVEKGYPLDKGLEAHPNVVRFDRRNPDDSINWIKSKMKDSGRGRKRLSDAAPWLLGGVFLITLVYLLSRKVA